MFGGRRGELVGCGVNGEGGVPWPEGSSAASNPGRSRHGLRGCSEVGELVRMRSKRRRRGAVARRVVGGFQPLGTNRSGPGGAGGTNEEDGRHGLRGCSEVGVFGGRRAGPDAE